MPGHSQRMTSSIPTWLRWMRSWNPRTTSCPPPIRRIQLLQQPAAPRGQLTGYAWANTATSADEAQWSLAHTAGYRVLRHSRLRPPASRDIRQYAWVSVSFRLLRDALKNLSLEPDEQRRELSGTVVTDELALDLDNAVRSLDEAQRTAGIALADGLLTELRRLNALLDAPPGDEFWSDVALDRHRGWAEAREIARALLALVPSA